MTKKSTKLKSTSSRKSSKSMRVKRGTAAKNRLSKQSSPSRTTSFVEKSESSELSSLRRPRLLIINEYMDVNNAVLGIYVHWINSFAKQCSHVHVITLNHGEAPVDSNVTVYSMGKESGVNKATQVHRFYSHLRTVLPQVDMVLVHMSPVWVNLGAPLFAYYNKPVFLWYAHKHVDLKLRVAAALCKGVFSSTPGSNLLESNRLFFVGQGIPLLQFPFDSADRTLPAHVSLLSVGRVTKSKDYDTVLDACELLHSRDVPFTLTIVGPALTDAEKLYDEQIRARVNGFAWSDKVTFTGAIANKDIVRYYHSHDVLINAAAKTGADKVVFEASATGCIPIVCDPALLPIVDDAQLRFEPGNAQSLCDRISSIYHLTSTQRDVIRAAQRKIMEHSHNSDVQVKALLSHMKMLRK
ncbi:MAG TPA: glycosyltransferase [Acidobacteriota bacterium]|nr:glycosyltransferase [Acidobacteriota bacterium]